MNLDYRSLIDQTFNPDSRVWVYQSSRLFSMGEALEIEQILNKFAENWKSHGTAVKASGYLFFGQFIILMADETASGVSGCSTDSSVRMVKDLEQKFKVNLFDRTTLAFYLKDAVQLLPLNQIQYAIDNGFVNSETLYFNNLVQTKSAFETNWIIPITKSWLCSRFQFSTTKAE